MEAMREIGAFLEGERKRQQLTLDAVSRHTRISVKVLRAIEEGELEVIGTPLLIRGFLRTYCEALGVDPRPILEEYGTEIHQYDDERDRLRRFEGWMKSAPSRGKFFFGVLALFAVVAVLAAGWALWWPGYQQKKAVSLSESPTVPSQQDLPTDLATGKSAPKTGVPPEAVSPDEEPGRSKEAETPAPGAGSPIAVSVPKIEETTVGEDGENREPISPVPSPEHGATPAGRFDETPLDQASSPVPPAGEPVPGAMEPESGGVVPPTDEAAGEPQVAVPELQKTVEPETGAEAEESRAEKHTVRIEAAEESWVQVRVDGAASESWLMKPGEERIFSAQETLRLWVGNAGGIRVFWDDKPLKPLGQRGEVVRVKLPNPRFMPEP